MQAALYPPEVRTLNDALRHRVQLLPDEEFVRVGDSPWLTARELDRRATAVAAGLRALGVDVGDRVATLLPNRIEFIELLFAVAKLGAVQVPMNYWLKGEFLRHQLDDCGARVLVADSAGVTTAAPLLGVTPIDVVVAVDEVEGGGVDTLSYGEIALADGDGFEPHPSEPSSLLAILYTSGTTGLPKGCMLSSGYFMTIGRMYGQREWVVAGDRLFTAWPLFHTSGQLIALVPALVNNASVCFDTEFHASTYMASAASAGANKLLGVGFMGQAILAQPPSPQDTEYRFDLAVWVPMPEQKQAEFEKRFGTPVLSEGFGQTEVVPVTASVVHGCRKRATSGQIVPTVEVRIVDEEDNEAPEGEVGEIAVRPRQPEAMFQGYWNNPAATVESWRGLWHHTGDAAFKDADGFLTFVDRKKDAVRRRGENVSSYQLEVAIAEHPSIAAVAVTAVPSPVGDDDIKASVVLADGETLDPAELFAFLRDSVPYYTIPRYVDIRAYLPTNAIGRVMKQVLREEGLPAGVIDFEALGYCVAPEERRGDAQPVVPPVPLKCQDGEPER